MSDQFKTIYEMKAIINRCFEECKDAGHTISYDTVGPHGVITVLINQDAIADHISKTLIGELLELEILRKLSPLFRQFRSIEKDLQFLDEQAARESGFQSLRIGQK